MIAFACGPPMNSINAFPSSAEPRPAGSVHAYWPAQTGLSETLPVLRQIPKSLFKLERLQPSPISILIRADGVIMNDTEAGNRAESLLIGINTSEGGT
jgi:hypothetical protein